MCTFVRKDVFAVALALVGAGVIAWWMFAVDPSRSAGGRVASNQKTHVIAPPDGTPFRYGPDINHGRADTPVNAREQALRGAGDAHAEAYRPARERRATRSTTESFLNRGMKSGH